MAGVLDSKAETEGTGNITVFIDFLVLGSDGGLGPGQNRQARAGTGQERDRTSGREAGRQEVDWNGQDFRQRGGTAGSRLERDRTSGRDAGWQEVDWNRTADAGRRAGVQEFGLAGWTAENEDKLMG